MGTELPPRKGAQQPPPLFGQCLLWLNGRPSQQLLSSCYETDVHFLAEPAVSNHWGKVDMVYTFVFWPQSCNKLNLYGAWRTAALLIRQASCSKAWPLGQIATSHLISGSAKKENVNNKMTNPLKFAGVPQTSETISAASGQKFTILWGHVEEILLLNKFFFPIVNTCLICEDIARQSCAMVPRWRFWRLFCVLYLQRAACSRFQTCILNSH